MLQKNSKSYKSKQKKDTERVWQVPGPFACNQVSAIKSKFFELFRFRNSPGNLSKTSKLLLI
jgi:hypothetical protein